MFLPLEILFEYWIQCVTFGLLYVMFMFRFSTRIFYRWLPGFVTDCSCGVWCRGLNTRFLYVGPFFLKSSLTWEWIFKCDITENNFFFVFDYVFTYSLMSHTMMKRIFHLPYFHVKNSALFFYIVFWYSVTFCIDVILTLWKQKCICIPQVGGGGGGHVWS